MPLHRRMPLSVFHENFSDFFILHLNSRRYMQRSEWAVGAVPILTLPHWSRVSSGQLGQSAINIVHENNKMFEGKENQT